MTKVYTIGLVFVAVSITSSCEAQTPEDSATVIKEFKCVEAHLPQAQKFFEEVFRAGEEEKVPITISIKYENGTVEFIAYPSPETGMVGGGGRIQISCESGEQLDTEFFR